MCEQCKEKSDACNADESPNENDKSYLLRMPQHTKRSTKVDLKSEIKKTEKSEKCGKTQQKYAKNK